MKKKSGLEILGGCLVAVIAFAIVVFLGAAIAMWLWNAIMVPVFGLPILGYWQMYGIMVLAKLIFGNISTSSYYD